MALGSLLSILSRRVIPNPSDFIEPRQPIGFSRLRYSTILVLVNTLYFTWIISTSLYSMLLDALIRQTAL